MAVWNYFVMKISYHKCLSLILGKIYGVQIRNSGFYYFYTLLLRRTHGKNVSQIVQRAFDLRFGKVGNVCIDLGGLQGTVPQEILDESDVGAGFQQMGGKAVA